MAKGSKDQQWKWSKWSKWPASRLHWTMLDTQFWMAELTFFSFFQPSKKQLLCSGNILLWRGISCTNSSCLKYLAEKQKWRERNHGLWNPIFNYALHYLSRHDSAGGVGLYSSPNKLLTDYLEKEQNMAKSEKRAARHIWLSWLTVVFELEERYPNALCLPNTGWVLSIDQSLLSVSAWS